MYDMSWYTDVCMCVLKLPIRLPLSINIMWYVYGSTTKFKMSCHWLVSCSLPPIPIMDSLA